MTGSLKSDNGKWYCIINLKDETGKRKQKWVNLNIDDKPGNKKLAEQARHKLLVEYDAKQNNVHTENNLFCDYVKIWLESTKGRLQPNTYESYQSNVDKHIYPYFKEKGMLLTDLVFSDVNNYYTTKSRCLSGNTLKKHHAIILQTLKRAVQDGLIKSNPATEIELPKAKKFVGKFLTVEQGNALLDAVKETTMEPVIILAMMYGLRRSEIAGLKWSAVDLKNDTLTIKHTVTRFKTSVAKDETKNKSSYRVLPLNHAVKAYLLRIRSQQAQDKLFLGEGYKDTEYVCRWADGHAISPDYMSATFNKLLKKNGYEHIRLHDLRHTCASYMLKTGCSMKEISDWLGHADIGTSMNIYAHLDTDAKKDVSNRLGSILSL